jgi:hypothetical protein
VGGAAGCLAVACLLILAACWRTHAQAAAPREPAVRLVADGLTASAGALALGCGWKLALALYLPDGLNGTTFTDDGRWVYYVLNEFGPFIGWLGVAVAAGAVAYLGLRRGLVARWLGVVSLRPPLAVLVMSCGLTVAGFPGVVGPIWLTVAGVGLVAGRHRVIGTRA